MSNLIAYLAKYISQELVAAINTTTNDSLRVVFSAPPRDKISELFEFLTSEAGCMMLETEQGNIDVPVYLVDQDVEDPHESSKAARCTPSYLVTIRNSNFPVWLALQEVGASTNASLSTAVKPLGIAKENSHFDLWSQAPVIRFLIEQYLSSADLADIEKQVEVALDHALYSAWSADDRYKDKRTVWKLLDKLFDVPDIAGAPHEIFSATLGFPCCSKVDIGSKDQIKMLDRISGLFQTLGLRSAFDELESNADEKLLPHVREMRAHIEKQGVIDANEFSRNPFQIYCPLAGNKASIPEWWYELTLEAWSQLLDTGSSPDHPVNDRLKVKLLNVVSVTPKGLTPLVCDCVDLEISIEGLDEITEVIIERSSGNAALSEVYRENIDQNTIATFNDSHIPDHERFIRYKISADGHVPVIIKTIVLDYYGPGIVALTANSTKATPFKINRKAKNLQNKKINRYECDLQLPSMGSHYLELFVSKNTRLSDVIKGYEIDAEHTESIERRVTRIDDNHYSCLIETDEECYYELNAYSPGMTVELPFRIYITSAESKQTGATSEFDRLVLMHRASATGTHASPRVDPISCRVLELEMWALESEYSYKPLVLGPDYLDHWCKPMWDVRPSKFSGLTMLVDPRPTEDEFIVPSDFLDARKKILDLLGTPIDEPTPTASVLKLYEIMGHEDSTKLLCDFLDAYLSWLESDYDNAVWSDVISIHAGQMNSKALDSMPYAILLSPFHPIRLAWQCCAQDVLHEAFVGHSRCPAASTMNPTSFPDCLVLPCRTATGNIERKPFVAMVSSSDYWSVLMSVDANNLVKFTNANSIFGDEFGITVDGLASGFSAQQVVRSFDEVSRLMSAKSTLRIGISSDTGGSGSCNEGIDIWCSENLGIDEDDWQDAGHKSVIVIDQRDPTLQPEPAVLASLTSRTDAAVRWFVGEAAQTKQKSDLSIIAHLSTMSHSFDVQGIRSAIDSSGLTRWRVRKQLPNQDAAFIAESRIGEISTNIDHGSISGKLLSCVDEIERQCRDDFDSYIFAPDISELTEVVDRSRYTALSSSNVDAACFFGSTDKAYLWDYELPSYARRAGENSGYYLLAKESSGMLHAVRSAIALLGDNGELNDAQISSLLEEISRRGMPTLKRLTSGGSMSLGEIGMLTALRTLQSEFEKDSVVSGILPVQGDDETLNLIISADPFQKHFDDLRSAIGFKHGERPDLLVMSIRFITGVPSQMRLSTVEVKARGGSMSRSERDSALKQASYFAEFLSDIQKKADNSRLWGIAWRNLLATILDYAFRVYGQLEMFMKHDEWAKQHSAILRSIADNDLDIDVDSRGRLMIIDNSGNNAQQDLDGDGFRETICLSHAEAFSVLARSDAAFTQAVNLNIGAWQLKPELPVESEDPALNNNRPINEVNVMEESNTSTKAEVTIEQQASDVYIDTDGLAESIVPEGQVDEKSVEGEVPLGIKFVVGKTIKQFTTEETSFFPGNTALNQLNVGVVGDLGTGKTQLVQALVQQLGAYPEMNRGKRPNILIFDYKKDYSKPDFVKATGARVVSPFDIPLNLFDVRDSSQKNKAWLERTKFFIDVLDKIYPGIGPVQRQRIKSAVRDSYDNAKHTGHIAPTINDVFDSYRQAVTSPDTPFNIMDDLVDGGYFVADSSDVIPFSEFLNGVVVIDLAEVGQDDRTKSMLVIIFLNLFYEHMLRIEKKEFIGEDPKLRFIDTMLLVDEADNIMRYEFDVLKKILLQGREFGVGVLLASQYLSHFKTSHENYLEPLLSWFVHKVPNVTVKELEGIGLTGVSSDAVDAIKSLGCHECLFKTLGVDGKVIRATPFFELMNN